MTTDIVAFVTNNDAPLTSPTDEPTIRIRRLDTGALVVTDQDMTEIGDGLWSYSFDESSLLTYGVRVDADPAASSQVTAAERYYSAIVGPDLARKVLLNKAVTSEDTPGVGQKTVDFYNDDQTTVIESIVISADGLTRTNP